MGLLDFIGDRLKVLHKSGNMPTAKSKAGFHFVSMEKRKAILVVSRGVVHTLWDTENYKTKKETDDALALKATQKEVDDHAKSIDVLSSTKAEKSVVDALQNGIIKQAAVDTYNDTSDGKTSLLNKYPTPKLGWDVLVKSENTRYNWNGSMWVDMETGNYPEDVVLKNDVFGIPTYPFIQDFGALEDKAFVEWQQAFPYIEYENGTKYPNAFYGIGLVRVLPDSNMFRVAIYGYYYNGSYYYIDATKSINIYATSRDEIVEFDINDADYDVKIKGLIDFSKLPEGDHIAKQFIFTDVIGVKQEIKALSVIVEENKSKGLKEPDIEVSIKTEQGLWMQKRVITVNKPNAVAGDQTNFNNLVDAVLSITDASETNPYEIQLYADIIATQKTDYHPIDNNTYALGWLKKHITIRGMGDTKTIYGELPEGLTQAEYSSYVGLHYDGGGILENIKVIAKNIRYAIHYDRSDDPKGINHNTKSTVRNCYLEHKGGYAGSPYTAWDAWGSGTGQAQILEFTGNTIVAARIPIRIHTNYNWNAPNEYIVTGNRIISANSSNPVAIHLDDISSYQKRYLRLSNNEIIGAVKCSYTLSNNYGIIKKSYPYTQITGGSNTPFLFVNETGKALKIISATAGNTSKVRLIQDTEGYGLIGTPIVKDGSIGLSGFILGDEEVVLTPVSTLTNGKANLLGHRLGDCSITPKTLILEIDGIQTTLTFDKNYSGGAATSATPAWTNQQVLDEINNKLNSKAICSLQGTYEDYYPELSDVLSSYKNTPYTVKIEDKDTKVEQPILKGMFVKRLGLTGVRKAFEGEIPEGMAIEDIGVDQLGRVIKNCYINKNSQYAPLFEIGSEIFADGDRFKISPNGKLIKDNSLTDSFAVALSSEIIYLK